jgi:OOP family OmpA-OmpF porin
MLLGSFAGVAHANDEREVWTTSDGEIVQNSWGNCVRSRWSSNDDACAPPTVVTLQQPQPQPHTIVAEADRTIFFGFNKADLTTESKSRLDTLANQLTSADDVEGAKIVGYADRIGTTSYNGMLSKKRADAVREYLIGRGFVKPSVTDVRWVGKSEPTATCPNNLSHQQLVDCLQPDRRVAVELRYKTETLASE